MFWDHHKSDSESDNEEIGVNERRRLVETWDIDIEDLERDFEQSSAEINVVVEASSRVTLINWIALFVCFWSAYFSVPDRGIDILLAFFKAIFQVLCELSPIIFSTAVLVFPSSFKLLKKSLSFKDKHTKYVVCPKCDTLYRFQDCITTRFGRVIAKPCSHIAFPNHRQLFRRRPCGAEVLKEIRLKNGQTKLYPHKVYCYRSIRETLTHFIKRPDFVQKCEIWRNRNVPDDILVDIYDGQVWKDWQYFNGTPFLAQHNNYAFMLNVDWFQPFKHSVYSVGVIYMVLLNLPRKERYKEENVIIVGVIPGPHEPKLTINTYLQPLVAELNLLWQEGIQVRPHGSRTARCFRAALLCIACDIPALRKVCGFLGCTAHRGCSKCKRFFPGEFSSMDFSGFEEDDIPRRNEEHRREAQKILNATTADERTKIETSTGTRYSELLQLPYFDCTRYHVVDPMHNLFLGTAKHLMKNVWLNAETPIISRENLNKIQEKVDDVKAPSFIGRLPKKISTSFGGFTADQWKTWTLLYSVFCMWNIIPTDDLELWRLFVLSCFHLCSPLITTEELQEGHDYLVRFCKSFENRYGKERVTPNMHLHLHLKQCILDYGPVYSFWLFSFERFNGILGAFQTNNRSVEIQIMRKFLQKHELRDIPLPERFQETFQPVFQLLQEAQQVGTLGESIPSIPSTLNLSVDQVQRCLEWSNINAYSCFSPRSIDVLDDDYTEYLLKTYETILPQQSVIECVTDTFERISTIGYSGTKLGSSDSRLERSSFILASWCGQYSGSIETDSFDLRPGVIDFFLKQTIKIDGKQESLCMAKVRWFQRHPERHRIGRPHEIWCRNLFEMEGPCTFIPIQRIHSQFVAAYDVIDKERVLIVCPLQRKLYGLTSCWKTIWR